MGKIVQSSFNLDPFSNTPSHKTCGAFVVYPSITPAEFSNAAQFKKAIT
jgi:hypothetical protein